MTREEIRAEALDRIARVLFARSGWPAPWSEVQQRVHRKAAAEFVAAIDDLLPTGEEWGVRAGSGVRAVSESGVLHLRVAGAEPTICKRYVHEWRDAR